MTQPDYNATYLTGGKVVHGTDGVITLGTNDNLSLAIAKLGYLHTCRYGDTLTGTFNVNNPFTWNFNAGGTISVADTATFHFYNSSPRAPFTVASTVKVTNLNCDLLDGYNYTQWGRALAVDGNYVALNNTDGTQLNRITVPYATYAASAGSAPLANHGHSGTAGDGGNTLTPTYLYATGSSGTDPDIDTRITAKGQCKAWAWYEDLDPLNLAWHNCNWYGYNIDSLQVRHGVGYQEYSIVFNRAFSVSYYCIIFQDISGFTSISKAAGSYSYRDSATANSFVAYGQLV